MPALITFVLRLFSCCTTTLLHAARTSDLRSLVNGDVPVGAARWICASSKLNKIIIQQSTRHLMQMTSRAERCQHESSNRRAAAKQQPRWPTSSSQASNLRSAHRVKTAAAVNDNACVAGCAAATHLVLPSQPVHHVHIRRDAHGKPLAAHAAREGPGRVRAQRRT
jgi:hypothetical protein